MITNVEISFNEHVFDKHITKLAIIDPEIKLFQTFMLVIRSFTFLHKLKYVKIY